MDRTRRGPIRNLLKYVSQFSDPKFNPERRTAMQLMAAAPLAPKLKLAGALQQRLDPVQFYRGLLTHGLDIAPEYTATPELLREAFLNELPHSNLKGVYDDWGQGGPGFMDDALSDAYSQAHDDWAQAFDSDNYTVENFTPEQVEKLDKARALYDQYMTEGNDDLDAQYFEAMNEFLGSIDPRDLLAEHGGDELYINYLDALRGQGMENYIQSEAERLGMSYDELVKKMGVEKFLEQAPQIGTATRTPHEGGYVDISGIPEYYYQDPEALRYAKLREMLDHPVLTPQQMLEATHGDVTEALKEIDAEAIGSNVYHDIQNYRLGYKGDRGLGDVNLERMHPDVRADMIRRFDDPRLPDYMQQDRKRFSDQEPLLTRVEDLPSFIGNRTSPLRVTYDRALRGRKSVAEPLPYLDVIKALPPEEYSYGGRVG